MVENINGFESLAYLYLETGNLRIIYIFFFLLIET